MVFLLGIMLIVAYAVVAEIVAIYLNRSIVKTADMMANHYMFNVRYSGFLIFFNIVMCSSLIAFAYFFTIDTGTLDGRSITAIILLAIGLSELVKMLFFKIEVNSNSIDYRAVIKNSSTTFDEISKVEAVRFFGLVIVDISSNDKKFFTLINTMSGYRLFIDRLKNEEYIEWVSISGTPLDKSDL